MRAGVTRGGLDGCERGRAITTVSPAASAAPVPAPIHRSVRLPWPPVADVASYGSHRFHEATPRLEPLRRQFPEDAGDGPVHYEWKLGPQRL